MYFDHEWSSKNMLKGSKINLHPLKKNIYIHQILVAMETEKSKNNLKSFSYLLEYYSLKAIMEF
jgi:hypothetical protein